MTIAGAGLPARPEMGDETRYCSNQRRFLLRKTTTLVAILVLGALAIPVGVFAAGGTFVDDDTSIFEADIEWLAAAGVTKGCNPPSNDEFCPEESVTRGQMAAFLHRFADSDALAALGIRDEDLYVSWLRWNPEETNGATITCSPGDVFIGGYAIEGPWSASGGWRLATQGPAPLPEELWTTPTTYANQPTVGGRVDAPLTGWSATSESTGFEGGAHQFALIAYCIDRP